MSVYVTDVCLVFEQNYKKQRMAKTLWKKNKWESSVSQDQDLLQL